MTPALVKIDVAACVLSRPVRELFNLADGGSLSEPGLKWAFDLAVNPAGRQRSLRFWMTELQARAKGQPTQYHQQDIQWLVSQILPGNRQSFNAGDVDRLFQIRHRTRLDYGAQLPGQRIGGATIYGRAALETFLSRRWIGAINGGSE